MITAIFKFGIWFARFLTIMVSYEDTLVTIVRFKYLLEIKFIFLLIYNRIKHRLSIRFVSSDFN